ncbi:hypothetical protein [Methylobacterium sp. E-005]|nr:hypothetical protein [Methylobacterium sp. E-005]
MLSQDPTILRDPVLHADILRLLLEWRRARTRRQAGATRISVANI